MWCVLWVVALDNARWCILWMVHDAKEIGLVVCTTRAFCMQFSVGTSIELDVFRNVAYVFSMKCDTEQLLEKYCIKFSMIQ